LTTILLVTREMTDVIEIGRNSLNCTGLAIFGTGQILACFHCSGTMDDLSERLIRLASGLQKRGHQASETNLVVGPFQYRHRFKLIEYIEHRLRYSETLGADDGNADNLSAGVTYELSVEMRE